MKRTLLLCALFLFGLASECWACEKFADVLQDPFGTVIKGASIAVKPNGSSTNAIIYSNATCTSVATNPVISSADGSYAFYATNGRYDLVITKTGFTFPAANTSDKILFDPDDDAGGLPVPIGPEGSCLLVSTGVAAWGTCPGAGAGAPTTATYLTNLPDPTLSGEQAMSLLGTGLILNTTGTGILSTYLGANCVNQVPVSQNPSGSWVCNTLNSAFVNTTIWTGTVSSGIVKAASQGVLTSATAGTDYASVSVSNSWADGVKQTFNPSVTSAGLNVGEYTGDPSTVSNADIWYDSTANKFRCRENGLSVNCIGAASAAPADATYLTTVAHAGLSAEVVVAPTDDSVMLGNGSTWEIKSIADCDNPTVSKLLYDTSTNAFSCGTDQSAGGGTTFDSIGNGTNTTATMTVGSGATLAPTGTGMIAATVLHPRADFITSTPFPAVNPMMHLICDTVASPKTINLLPASFKMAFFIKNLGSNSCTVSRNGSDTIDGGTSAILRNIDDSFVLISDGVSRWNVF